MVTGASEKSAMTVTNPPKSSLPESGAPVPTVAPAVNPVVHVNKSSLPVSESELPTPSGNSSASASQAASSSAAAQRYSGGSLSASGRSFDIGGSRELNRCNSGSNKGTAGTRSQELKGSGKNRFMVRRNPQLKEKVTTAGKYLCTYMIGIGVNEEFGRRGGLDL